MTGRETGIRGDMSKKQLKEHKQENQRRKTVILKWADLNGKRNSVWFNGGVIQDGKHSIKATHGQD